MLARHSSLLRAQSSAQPSARLSSVPFFLPSHTSSSASWVMDTDRDRTGASQAVTTIATTTTTTTTAHNNPPSSSSSRPSNTQHGAASFASPSRPSAMPPASHFSFTPSRSRPMSAISGRLPLQPPTPTPPSSVNTNRASSPSRQHVTPDPQRRSLLAMPPPPQPPLPSSSLLCRSQPTSPFPKRVRLQSVEHDQPSSSSSATCLPLSGLARPLPPPTPSPSAQQAARASAGNTPLRPLNPPSIQDIQALLPPPQPPPARARALPATNSAAAQPEIIQPETVPWSTRFIPTSFLPIDTRITSWYAALNHANTHNIPDISAPAESVEQQATATAACQVEGASESKSDEVLGLRSGDFLEVIGPPGSGKTSFALQAALQARLSSLVSSRKQMSLEDDQGRSDLSVLFTEEYWDAELTSASQVLFVDTEGGALPERILDATWSYIQTLWLSHTGLVSSHLRGLDAKARSSLPEVVRRCVAATLEGIHLVRITRPSELAALLFELTFRDSAHQDEEEEQQNRHKRSKCFSPIPERLSLVVLDSISHCLRANPTGSEERASRAFLLEQLGKLQARMNEPRLAPAPSESDAYVPAFICTNQMSVRMYSPDGASSRFTNREATSFLMPQLVGSMRQSDAGMTLGSARLADTASFGTIRRSGQTQMDTNGWGCSVLGQNVWRVLFFRDGVFGDR